MVAGSAALAHGIPAQNSAPGVGILHRMVAPARPSPRCAQLLSEATRRMVASSDLLEAVDAAVLANAEPAVAGDPLLAETLVASNHANIAHWATATLADPGGHVAPNVGPGTVAVAREMVRRGLDEAMVDAYRSGQNVVWRWFMAIAFDLSTDPAELHELLDTAARSIFTFVDETIAGITAEIDRERAQLITGTHAERLEVVTLVLEGAPIAAERASARLGYELGRRHLAAIAWGQPGAVDQAALDPVAEALARAAGARRPFTVVAGAASLWIWCAVSADPEPAALEAALADAHPGVRLAVGSAGDGIDGFRRGHLDALATQRLMHRARGDVRLARYEDVRAVVLASADEERALEFVARTLGELAEADEVLRETVRVYVREDCNAARTARVLFAHRNTVLGRLARAEELLPEPLAGRAIEVGLALELARWLGTSAGAAS